MKPAAVRRNWKGLALRFSLSLAVFVLCLGIFEFILRLQGYGQLEIYDPDPKLYWRLKPNQTCYTKVGHKLVHINSHGTRGEEFQTIKPTNTIRILALGDSRTFGWGLGEQETYCALLQKSLQTQVGSSRRVEVINTGVNAWSYAQMLVYFREFGLRYQPDIVVLAEANPWTQFSEKNSPEFVNKFMTRVRLKNFLRRSAIYHYAVEVKLRAFYERHRKKFIPVDPAHDPMFKEQQQTEPETVFQDGIDGLCKLAQQGGVKAVLLYLPSFDEATATNSPAVLKIKTEIGQKRGVPLIDLSPEVRAQGNALFLEGDPVHFNATGNEIVARRLLEVLKPFVAIKESAPATSP